MLIPQTYPQFLDSEALIIVAGKLKGVIYRIADGEILEVNTLEEQITSLSDDEGFFFGGGTHGGGSPKDRTDEDEYVHKLRKQIATELDTLVQKESAQVLYVFEPEHLKGRIVEELQKHGHLHIHTVAYGNFVDESPLQLLERINTFINSGTVSTSVDFDEDLKRHS